MMKMNREQVTTVGTGDGVDPQTCWSQGCSCVLMCVVDVME